MLNIKKRMRRTYDKDSLFLLKLTDFTKEIGSIIKLTTHVIGTKGPIDLELSEI